MKRILTVLVVIGSAVTISTAQTGETSGQKTLAATMNVHVFPSEGQTSDQQSMDEVECYNWAVENTGTDPFDLAKQAQQQQQQAEAAQQEVQSAGKGAGAKGAVGGAAVGAAAGKIISDDAGKGAAYGAAAGGIAARRKAKKGKKEAGEQIEEQSQNAQAATSQQLDGFKKSFSVCLEAKKYMVKF
jgi:outer membrane lipoprotein SlyB